jgi:TetR/AcrR family transcriptional regulator
VRRDPKRTRQRIIRSAAAEFAKRGYDGARVDGIVNRLGISKNLLYHYFRSKEELFIVVMEHAYDEMRQRHQDMQLLDLEPIEAMARLVSYTFQHFIDKPEIINLLNSENIHEARHIRKSKQIKALYNPLLDAIQTILEKGQQSGDFRPNVDPMQLYISISGLGYFYLSNRHTLSTIFRRKLATPEGLRERHQHIIDVIMGYLRYQEDDVILPLEIEKARGARKTRATAVVPSVPGNG